MNFNNAINILKLPNNFNEQDLKKAYHREALKNHPDKTRNNCGAKFNEINRA